MCIALSLAFLIFWDRTPPITYLMPFAQPNEIRPGGDTRLAMRLDKVSRICHGRFTRSFIDSTGRRFPMGTYDTVYQYYVTKDDPTPVYYKWVRIPMTDADAREVHEGPGVYESLPEWWCNPVQRLYPIQGAPVRIAIKMLPGAS